MNYCDVSPQISHLNFARGFEVYYLDIKYWKFLGSFNGAQITIHPTSHPQNIISDLSRGVGYETPIPPPKRHPISY